MIRNLKPEKSINSDGNRIVKYFQMCPTLVALHIFTLKNLKLKTWKHLDLKLNFREFYFNVTPPSYQIKYYMIGNMNWKIDFLLTQITQTYLSKWHGTSELKSSQILWKNLLRFDYVPSSRSLISKVSFKCINSCITCWLK